MFVSADYYRYTDEKGILHFTDNLMDVPLAQRDGSNRYEEVTDPSNAAEDQKTASGLSTQITDKQILESNQGNAQKESNLVLESRILNSEKETLDIAYAQLLAKKQVLKEEKSSVLNKAALKVYQNKIKILNQEIIDFEKGRQEFEKKATKFNNAKDAQ